MIQNLILTIFLRIKPRLANYVKKKMISEEAHVTANVSGTMEHRLKDNEVVT